MFNSRQYTKCTKLIGILTIVFNIQEMSTTSLLTLAIIHEPTSFFPVNLEAFDMFIFASLFSIIFCPY